MKMDDKTRQSVAIVLCLMVTVVYLQAFLLPKVLQSRQRPRIETQQGQAANPNTTQLVNGGNPNQTAPIITNGVTLPAAIQSAALIANGKTPTRAEYHGSPGVTIETDKAIINLSTLGGRILSLELKNHKKNLGGTEPLNMIRLSDDVPPPLGVYTAGLSDAATNYKIASSTQGLEQEPNSFKLKDAQELVLALTGTLPNGQNIEKRLTFYANSYLIKTEVIRNTPSEDGSAMILEWTEYAPGQDQVAIHEQKMFMSLGLNNKIATVMYSGVQNNFTSLNARWLSFNDAYFSSILIPQQVFQGLRYRKLDSGSFIYQVLGEPSRVTADLYIGPKEQYSLALAGHDLHRNIDLGWFSFIAAPMMELLRLFDHLLGNYGLSIILLTLLIKISFYALTKKQMASVKSMQQIQPEVQALRDRIKDPGQLNQEMMALYKKRGINPMAGCFPIFVQIPFFVGLYNVLYNAIELRHSPFALWINDLSKQEGLAIPGLPFSIPVMVLIMGALMFYQQQKTPTPGMDPAQRKIMMVLPVVFTVMFIPFPAGLVLYWLVNQIMSLVQQNHLVSGKIFGGRVQSPFVGTLLAAGMIFVGAFILTLL